MNEVTRFCVCVYLFPFVFFNHFYRESGLVNPVSGAEMALVIKLESATDALESCVQFRLGRRRLQGWEGGVRERGEPCLPFRRVE